MFQLWPIFEKNALAWTGILIYVLSRLTFQLFGPCQIVKSQSRISFIFQNTLPLYGRPLTHLLDTQAKSEKRLVDRLMLTYFAARPLESDHLIIGKCLYRYIRVRNPKLWVKAAEFRCKQSLFVDVLLLSIHFWVLALNRNASKVFRGTISGSRDRIETHSTSRDNLFKGA